MDNKNKKVVIEGSIRLIFSPKRKHKQQKMKQGKHV